MVILTSAWEHLKACVRALAHLHTVVGIIKG